MCSPRLSVLPYQKDRDDFWANFACGNAQDFRAPDWPCGLRENLDFDPLMRPGHYQAGTDWPTGETGIQAIQKWKQQAPNRVLGPSLGELAESGLLPGDNYGPQGL